MPPIPKGERAQARDFGALVALAERYGRSRVTAEVWARSVIAGRERRATGNRVSMRRKRGAWWLA